MRAKIGVGSDGEGTGSNLVLCIKELTFLISLPAFHPRSSAYWVKRVAGHRPRWGRGWVLRSLLSWNLAHNG